MTEPIGRGPTLVGERPIKQRNTEVLTRSVVVALAARRNLLHERLDTGWLSHIRRLLSEATKDTDISSGRFAAYVREFDILTSDVPNLPVMLGDFPAAMEKLTGHQDDQLVLLKRNQALGSDGWQPIGDDERQQLESWVDRLSWRDDAVAEFIKPPAMPGVAQLVAETVSLEVPVLAAVG